MLFIYVHLRYQRQLTIINPESVSSFFKALSDSVNRNGGSEQHVPGGVVYRFSREGVGFAFAASRVIADISAELGRHRNRLREYLVLVDRAPWDDSADFVSNHMDAYQNVLLPDEGILLSTDALSDLNAYISHDPVDTTPFYAYTGSRLEAKTFEEFDVRDSALKLYTEGGIDRISSALDMLERVSLVPGNGQEAAAVAMYRAFRYEYKKPDYLVSACESWIDSALASLPSSAFPLRVIGTDDQRGMEGFAREHVPGGNGVVRERAVRYQPCDISGIPPDMLDLGYLAFRISKYACGDELSRFFAALGRNEDFLVALGRWLYSFGLLADPRDFRSLNYDVYARLREWLGERCAELDVLIADFLWAAYETGEVQPAFSLLDVLTELGFRVPDRFLVACLYHGGDTQEDIESLSGLFSNLQLMDSVRTLERARALYRVGNTGESLQFAREVLHRFQKAQIPAGEYHAFRLISDVSLARGKGDEAVTYLEYAIENAERLHDAAFILQTRFDIAMLHFVNGDLFTARETLGGLEGLIAKNLAKELELVSVFMNGRIAFELGEYPESTALFQRAGAIAGTDGFPEAIPLCKAWFARSIAHQHRYLQAIEMLSSCADTVPDAWPFLLEASILAGKPLVGKGVPDSFGTRFDFGSDPDRFNWSSGFTLAEDRLGDAVPGDRTPVRMFEAFSRYYRASVDSGTGNAYDGVAIGLSELAREAVERGDPLGQVYYYLCYLLGTANPGVDTPERLSCLSRGFKYLQVRAGSISNVALRETFLQNPSWNNRLYRAARENKLI